MLGSIDRWKRIVALESSRRLQVKNARGMDELVSDPEEQSLD